MFYRKSLISRDSGDSIDFCGQGVFKFTYLFSKRIDKFFISNIDYKKHLWILSTLTFAILWTLCHVCQLLSLSTKLNAFWVLHCCIFNVIYSKTIWLGSYWKTLRCYQTIEDFCVLCSTNLIFTEETVNLIRWSVKEIVFQSCQQWQELRIRIMICTYYYLDVQTIY